MKEITSDEDKNKTPGAKKRPKESSCTPEEFKKRQKVDLPPLLITLGSSSEDANTTILLQNRARGLEENFKNIVEREQTKKKKMPQAFVGDITRGFTNILEIVKLLANENILLVGRLKEVKSNSIYTAPPTIQKKVGFKTELAPTQ